MDTANLPPEIQRHLKRGWEVEKSSMDYGTSVYSLKRKSIASTCMRTSAYGVSAPLLLAGTVTAVVLECLFAQECVCISAFPLVSCDYLCAGCTNDPEDIFCLDDGCWTDEDGSNDDYMGRVQGAANIMKMTMLLNVVLYEYCQPCQPFRKEVRVKDSVSPKPDPFRGYEASVIWDQKYGDNRDKRVFLTIKSP